MEVPSDPSGALPFKRVSAKSLTVVPWRPHRVNQVARAMVFVQQHRQKWLTFRWVWVRPKFDGWSLFFPYKTGTCEHGHVTDAHQSPVRVAHWQVLHMAGDEVRLTVPVSTLGRALQKMVSEKLETKPGARVMLHHKTTPLRLDKTLAEQDIEGRNASLSCTYVPINLHDAIRFVIGFPTLGEDFAMEGVTSLANCPPGNHLLHLPHSLRGLSFESHFNESLENVELPSGLQSLTFGSHFNQSLAGVNLPSCLQSLAFGFDFNQSLVGVNLPDSLGTLDFGWKFNKSLVGVILPSGLQSLTFGNRLQPEHGWSELAKRSSKLIFWRRFWPESRGCEISTRSSKVISRLVFQPEPRRSELAR